MGGVNSTVDRSDEPPPISTAPGVLPLYQNAGAGYEPGSANYAPPGSAGNPVSAEHPQGYLADLPTEQQYWASKLAEANAIPAGTTISPTGLVNAPKAEYESASDPGRYQYLAVRDAAGNITGYTTNYAFGIGGVVGQTIQRDMVTAYTQEQQARQTAQQIAILPQIAAPTIGAPEQYIDQLLLLEMKSALSSQLYQKQATNPTDSEWGLRSAQAALVARNAIIGQEMSLAQTQLAQSKIAWSAYNQYEAVRTGQISAQGTAVKEAMGYAAQRQAAEGTYSKVVALAGVSDALYMAQEAARTGTTIDPYVAAKAAEQGFVGVLNVGSLEASRSTVPVRDYTTYVAPPTGAIIKQEAAYYPYGAGKVEVFGKTFVDPVSGKVSTVEQIPGRNITNLIGGGGDYSAQSGAISVGKPNSAVVYTRDFALYPEGDVRGISPASASNWREVLASPEKYSTGGELYRGMYGTLLDSRTIEGVRQASGFINEPSTVRGSFPLDSGILATYVTNRDYVKTYRPDVVPVSVENFASAPALNIWRDDLWNRDIGKYGRFVSAESLPAEQRFGYTTTPSDALLFGRIPTGTKWDRETGTFSPVDPLISTYTPDPFVSKYTPPTQVVSTAQVDTPQTDYFSGKTTFGAMAANVFGGLQNKPQTESKVWTEGSNQTITNLGASIDTRTARLNEMDTEITKLGVGNITGKNWTGDESGYRDISSKVEQRNLLNAGISKDVDTYNEMGKQNPFVTHTETTTETTVFGAPAQPIDIGGLVSGNITFDKLISQNTLESVTKDVSKNPLTKFVTGSVYGAGYGAAGYGAAELGVTELAMANPVGAGVVIGAAVVLALEHTGRLGFTGETKEYSVRTAGEQYGTWVDPLQQEIDRSASKPIVDVGGFVTDYIARSDANLMTPGTGTYTGSELSTRRYDISELPLAQPLYSEITPGVIPTSELPVAQPAYSELPLYDPYSKTTEGIITGNAVTEGDVGYVDPFGQSYPGGAGTNIEAFKDKSLTQSDIEKKFIEESKLGEQTNYSDKDVVVSQTDLANPSSIVTGGYAISYPALPDSGWRTGPGYGYTSLGFPYRERITNRMSYNYDYVHQTVDLPPLPRINIPDIVLPPLGFGQLPAGGGAAYGRKRGKRKFTEIFNVGLDLATFGSQAYNWGGGKPGGNARKARTKSGKTKANLSMLVKRFSAKPSKSKGGKTK